MVDKYPPFPQLFLGNSAKGGCKPVFEFLPFIDPSKKPSDHIFWQPKCSALLCEVFPPIDLLTSLPVLPDLADD